MQATAARLVLAIAVVVASGGCGGDDAGSDAGPSASATGEGAGTLVIDGQELGFVTDTCYEGEGIELSEDLRLHVEGTGDDEDGTERIVQIVRTSSPFGELIDVIRVREVDGPPGAAWEAQRVHNPDTGDVHDLWGDGTSPLLEVERKEGALTVVAHEAVFGEFPGGGGDTRVLGTGELSVSCSVQDA